MNKVHIWIRGMLAAAISGASGTASACFDVQAPERQLILMKFCKLLRRNSQPDHFIAKKGDWADDQKEFFENYFKSWIKDADGACSRDLIVLSAMSKV